MEKQTIQNKSSLDGSLESASGSRAGPWCMTIYMKCSYTRAREKLVNVRQCQPARTVKAGDVSEQGGHQPQHSAVLLCRLCTFCFVHELYMQHGDVPVCISLYQIFSSAAQFEDEAGRFCGARRSSNLRLHVSLAAIFVCSAFL